MWSYTRIVKLAFALALAVHGYAQVPGGQPTPKPDAALEVHLKAVKLLEISGGRDRLVAALPEMIESGKVAMQKECPTAIRPTLRSGESA